MISLTPLVEGYRRFLTSRYKQHAGLYENLSSTGQSPSIMVIACCDSRVDPVTIFDAAPGELFVVRNVANLVPPYELTGDLDDTGAAVEFAVKGLGVGHILVMGHAQCGGVKAFLQDVFDPSLETNYILNWMSIMKPARAEVLRQAPHCEPEELQRMTEFSAVRQSLKNLATFSFVRDRLEQGVPALHGAYFGIASGELLALDPKNGRFEQVS